MLLHPSRNVSQAPEEDHQQGPTAGMLILRPLVPVAVPKKELEGGQEKDFTAPLAQRLAAQTAIPLDLDLGPDLHRGKGLSFILLLHIHFLGCFCVLIPIVAFFCCRYRRQNSDSSRSPSSQSSSHSSPSWSRSPPRRRKYSYSSSRSGSWSRSRSRSLSPQRRVQWSGSMGLHRCMHLAFLHVSHYMEHCCNF